MDVSLILIAASILMLLGLAGTLLPALPGTPLIFAGAFIYAWSKDFLVVTWVHIAVLAGLMLASFALDYLAAVIGAKKYGASRLGVMGAFAGGMLGLVLGGFIGIIAGSFAGAVIMELVRGRSLNDSVGIGYGTLAGLACGALGKLLIAISMIAVFCIAALG